MRRGYSPPKPQAIDDQTGFKVDHSALKRQWDGAFTVDPDKRNPQDLIRSRPDNPTIPNPRPEPADIFIAGNIIWEDGFTPIIGETGSPVMTEGIFGGEGL
jgi:hypothetical protein